MLHSGDICYFLAHLFPAAGGTPLPARPHEADASSP
jgi:hypothetical protein